MEAVEGAGIRCGQSGGRRVKSEEVAAAANEEGRGGSCGVDKRMQVRAAMADLAKGRQRWMHLRPRVGGGGCSGWAAARSQVTVGKWA